MTPPTAAAHPADTAPVAPVAVTARCAGCGACLLTCPVHAIRPLGGALLVRAELCTGCLECVEVCPVDAIEETVGTAGAVPPGAPDEAGAPDEDGPPAGPLETPEETP